HRRAGRFQFTSVPYYDNIPPPDCKAAAGSLPTALQVRHLLQETALTFVRFHENAFLSVLKAFSAQKTLAFLCEKWYVVSQQSALDTRIAYALRTAGIAPGALCTQSCYFLHLPSYHLPCLPARAKK